jgi:hypothetical protein
MRDARHAGLIDESLVRDGRSPEGGGLYFDESVSEAVDTIVKIVTDAAEHYDLDPQTDQPQRLEVWSEADDLTDRLRRITEPLGVPVYSGAGYISMKPVLAVARRVAERDVPTTTLYIGDLDPHGGRIFDALAEDAQGWITRHYGRPADWWTIVQLAITTEQAAALGVLDSEGKAEADALPVDYMDDLLTAAIAERTVPGAREELAHRLIRERAEIRRELRARLEAL